MDLRNRFLKLLMMENPGRNTSGSGKDLIISYMIYSFLGGGFIFLFSLLFGEDSQF